MHRTRTGLWIAITVMTLAGAGIGLAAEQEAGMQKEKAFLMKAAGGQKGEIALGQMAAERAESDKVKQFGHRMIEDHQKASQEVSKLASQEGIDLPSGMPTMQKEKAQQLSQLSGKDFDRAYITYMLREHMKDVTEFEHSAKHLTDPQVQQWASATLPVLKEHLKIARNIADGLRIDTQKAE